MMIVMAYYLQENLLKVWAWASLIFIPTSFLIIVYLDHYATAGTDQVYVWRLDIQALGFGSKRPKLFKRKLKTLRLNYLNFHIRLDIDSPITKILFKWGSKAGAETRDKVQSLLMRSSNLLAVVGAFFVVASIDGPPGLTLASGSMILFAKLILGRIDIVAKSNAEIA